MKALVAIGLCMLLLAACRTGTTVDHDAPSFVDRESIGSSVDSGSGSAIDDPASVFRTEPPVVNADDNSFVPPPGNYTENATIDIETKKGFIGKDVVKLWVWNDRGSQSLIVAEGGIVDIPKMGISVKVGPIGHENSGKLIVYINEKASKSLGYRDETKVGSTWVFVSDIFLNAAQ